MKFKYKIVLFSLIVLFSFCLDTYNNPCNNNVLYTNILHFIHHTSSNFLYYGSLFFGYHLYHFIIILITAIGWHLNNGRCIISDIYNKNCGFPINIKHRDFTYYLIQNIPLINIYFFIFIIILYDLKYIFYKLK